MTDTLPAPGEPDPGLRTTTVTAAGARRRVRELLAARAPGAVPRAVGDALLVTSEIVTNAVRHGGGATGFTAEVAGGVLVLAVTDRSPARPVVADPDIRPRIGGYGWPLVLSLAVSVEIAETPGGKTVRVRLPLT